MATSSTVAFGQYLRTLRERRGLSLDDVATLSRTFADPVEKGYLSRCENGHQSLALSKMIALSRIYEVSAEVLTERLELDLEVEKRGIDEKHTAFEELTNAATASIERGDFWCAYVQSRAAALRAGTAPLMVGFDNRDDQLRCAVMNFSTAASRLGRHRLALNELQYIHSAGGLGNDYQALLFERFSVLYRALGNMTEAVSFADRAIALAETVKTANRYLGSIYGSRARLAYEMGDLQSALQLYQRAYEESRKAGRIAGSAIELQNIAQLYYELKRFRAARRALHAADELARPANLNRVLAYSRLLLGEIEAAEGRQDLAKGHWLNVVEIARRVDDRVAVFKAEFQLFQQAAANGEREFAALLEKRLRRRLPWIPTDVVEAGRFRREHPSRKAPRRIRVV